MRERKITIKVYDDTTDEAAINAVLQVVKDGRVSGVDLQEHYCCATVFRNGIEVYAERTKSGGDMFRVSGGQS